MNNTSWTVEMTRASRDYKVDATDELLVAQGELALVEVLNDIDALNQIFKLGGQRVEAATRRAVRNYKTGLTWKIDLSPVFDVL